MGWFMSFMGWILGRLGWLGGEGLEGRGSSIELNV